MIGANFHMIYNGFLAESNQNGLSRLNIRLTNYSEVLDSISEKLCKGDDP